MLRRRVIAAAPARPASEAWDTIVTLIADTLERSPNIERSGVTSALAAAEPAGLMLIAGGHLERHPLTLVADPVHLEISTVSGADALREDEDLDPVVGGASAKAWVLHFPTPDPLGTAITAVVDGKPHVSVANPASPSADASKTGGPLVTAAGLEALTRDRQR